MVTGHPTVSTERAISKLAVYVSASGIPFQDVGGGSQGKSMSRHWTIDNQSLRYSYTLSLQSYPGFPQISPFKDWDPGNPTASLDWYDAYNRTKHDREDNLSLATLDNAVKSVGAAVVMFYAQFGFTLGPTGGDLKSPIIRNIFRSQVDFEKHWQECYVPRFTLVDNDPKPLSSDWTPTNYPL